MIYESERKMTYKEQEAYDLGYMNGKRAAMCSPWVKTSDRLPTEADARENGCLPCVLSATQYAVTDGVHEKVFTFYDVKTIGEVVKNHNLFTRSVYWMPLPKLPEVEG